MHRRKVLAFVQAILALTPRDQQPTVGWTSLSGAIPALNPLVCRMKTLGPELEQHTMDLEYWSKRRYREANFGLTHRQLQPIQALR